MKNSFCFTIVLILFLSITCKSNLETESDSPLTREAAPCSSVKNNQVDFYTEGSLKISGFKISDYSITKGQTWDGAFQYFPSDNHFELEVLAGRKGSFTPTKWFINVIGEGSPIFTAKNHLDTSSGNFAFRGTLIFFNHGYEFQLDLCLLQFHMGWHDLNPHNYWALGGKSFHKIDLQSAYTEMTCVSNPDYSIKIKISSGHNTHSFTIEQI